MSKYMPWTKEQAEQWAEEAATIQTGPDEFFIDELGDEAKT